MSNSSTSDSQGESDDPYERIAEHRDTLEMLAEKDPEEIPLAKDAQKFLNILDQRGDV